MAIPYRTAKSNILAIVILGSTAKFNFRQYFQLYSILIVLLNLNTQHCATYNQICLIVHYPGLNCCIIIILGQIKLGIQADTITQF